MKYYTFGTLAFILASFIVQALSHFTINTEHYSEISFIREEPIMILGILTMLIQGFILTYFYQFIPKNRSALINGLAYSLLMGLFFSSYIWLVEPSKYQVPSISSWMMVEFSASLVQFSLFGVMLGLVFNKFGIQLKSKSV